MTLKIIFYTLARLFCWAAIFFSFFLIDNPHYLLFRLLGLIVGVEGLILLTMHSVNQRKDPLQ